MSIGGRARVALLAIEQLAEHGRAALLGRHPRSFGPRRIVARVLEVAADELRDPVAFGVSMKSGNRSFHSTARAARDVRNKRQW